MIKFKCKPIFGHVEQHYHVYMTCQFFSTFTKLFFSLIFRMAECCYRAEVNRETVWEQCIIQNIVFFGFSILGNFLRRRGLKHFWEEQGLNHPPRYTLTEVIALLLNFYLTSSLLSFLNLHSI